MMMNNNFMNQLNQLRQNPLQFLMQRNLNVPQNMSNDPNQIIQHLLNTGQISQQQFNYATQTARQKYSDVAQMMRQMMPR